tara:strand:- start:32 stop:664 length:633 start_codon:yes stop_codon:yes gene_type:complete
MIKIITILIIIFPLNLLSQGFEGLITYNISHSNIDSSKKEFDIMPSKLDFYISGELARVDQFTKIGIQTTIIDTLSKKHILLINLMEKKFGIILTNLEDSNEIEKIRYTNEIAAFSSIECKKAIINNLNLSNNRTSISTVYYTNEISNSYNVNFKGLNGFPLNYEIVSENIISTYTIVDCINKKIDPKLFEIDKNTLIYTMEDFKALMHQ